MKVALMSWNPFQLAHFKNLIPYFDDVVAIIIKRQDNLSMFDQEFLDGLGCEVRYVSSGNVKQIDRLFDVVLFQSPFPQIEMFKESKLVCVQYGLAKERHNYGEWRSLAHMNVMYGDYSTAFTKHFTPSFSVGNPKFDSLDEWSDEKVQSFKNDLGLDTSKKTLLYMPTWGELGSYERLIATLAGLKDRYNIMVKMHHNNALHLARWRQMSESLGIKWNFEGHFDSVALMKASDLVISDFSGAIFDAVYLELPIVLYQEGVDALQGVQKFDYSSLEYARRDDIGYVCEKLDDFEATIARALDQGVNPRLRQLKSELFADDREKASQRIYKLVTDLHEGRIEDLTRCQQWVREVTVSERNLKRQSNRRKRRWRKLVGWLRR